MQLEPAASVSKGTFAYQGRRKKLDAEEYIRCSHSVHNFDDYNERLELFKEASSNIQRQADLQQEEINNQIFDDLISYLNEVHRHFVPFTEDDDCQLEPEKKRKKISSEIPAAALIMGVNTPDHEGMFLDLVAMIKKRVTPHIALIKSVKCSTIKSIVMETVSQLTGTTAMDDDNEDDILISTTKRKTLSNMKLVVDWYSSLYKSSPDFTEANKVEFVCLSPSKTPITSPVKDILTPKKLSLCLRRISLVSPQKVEPQPKEEEFKTISPSASPMTSPTKRMTRMSLMSPVKTEVSTSSRGQKSLDFASPVRKRPLKLKLARVKAKCKPLVIILEDFEGFPTATLQDYITILSHHHESIPVILIFGIATTISAIHRLLPHSVSSHLSIHKFQSMMSSAHLSKLLEKILLNGDCPFKLDSKVFNFLLDNFLFNDFSVQNFIRSFKLSMMGHFQCPMSILCTDFDKIKPTLKKLSNKRLDCIRTLPSFRKYVESCQPQEQISLLEESKWTKKTIMRMMVDLHMYHRIFFPIFRCLHSLTSRLPQFPLGKTPRELYSYCLHGPVYECEEYSQAFLLIRNFSRTELLETLAQMNHILASVEQPTEELGEAKNHLKELLFKLESFDGQFADTGMVDSVMDDMLNQKLDITSLKKILRSSEDKKKVLPDHHLRQKIIDYLDELFRKFLKHPRSFPLHEVLYFSGVEFLRSRVLPSPRSSIQRALSYPYYYLQNDKLQVNHDQITSDLPDLCIAYKLHLECGKLINLFDWLQAFAMILEAEQDEDKEDIARKQVDRTVQARFVRAVSELQFLGFVKPTRRKTDHVARLTWGNC